MGAFCCCLKQNHSYQAIPTNNTDKNNDPRKNLNDLHSTPPAQQRAVTKPIPTPELSAAIAIKSGTNNNVINIPNVQQYTQLCVKSCIVYCVL